MTYIILTVAFIVEVAFATYCMTTGSVKKAGGGETADNYYVFEKMNELVLTFFNVYLKGVGSFTAVGPY